MLLVQSKTSHPNEMSRNLLDETRGFHMCCVIGLFFSLPRSVGCACIFYALKKFGLS